MDREKQLARRNYVIFCTAATLAMALLVAVAIAVITE
jgi:hypothetical protein